MSLFSRVTKRIFRAEIRRQVSLAVRALDDPSDRLAAASTYPRDRHDYDREAVLADALQAWRVNPLARRIVGLTTQYVVGGGLGVASEHEWTNRTLQEFWHHRFNRMPIRCFEWCDELSRSGELFILVSTDAAGMSYVRAIPAADIAYIETAENDLEQELTIWEKPSLDGSDTSGPNGLLGKPWAVYNPNSDSRTPEGRYTTVMLHYTVNRPVGAKHGESDLAPLLRWLTRYAAWLEDRSRLNRYRQTFMFLVQAKYTSQAERLQRQSELNMNPPNPGSILVADESERWSVLNPQLASFEAAEDGLALKKMVAAGSGIPLHFLAEPESATRTTAEASGGPTYRHYQQRQLYFLWLIEDLLRAVLRRRKQVDRLVHAEAPLAITGTDISARDNRDLAEAAAQIVAAFIQLRDRGLIDDAELLRMVYRFAGEVVDIADLLARGAAGASPAGAKV